jgi:hypothetical protein
MCLLQDPDIDKAGGGGRSQQLGSSAAHEVINVFLYNLTDNHVSVPVLVMPRSDV